MERFEPIRVLVLVWFPILIETWNLVRSPPPHDHSRLPIFGVAKKLRLPPPAPTHTKKPYVWILFFFLPTFFDEMNRRLRVCILLLLLLLLFGRRCHPFAAAPWQLRGQLLDFIRARWRCQLLALVLKRLLKIVTSLISWFCFLLIIVFLLFLKNVSSLISTPFR